MILAHAPEPPGRVLLLHEGVPLMFLFFGPGVAGSAVIAGSFLSGMIPVVACGLLLALWTLLSSAVCVWSFCKIDDRKRREAALRSAAEQLLPLASRIITLYSLPAVSDAGKSRAEEVFALYRQADEILRKQPRAAGDSIERGILLADEVLAEHHENPPEVRRRSGTGRRD